MFLTDHEKERYHRHLIIPEIGEEGQIKIKNAKVLVVGAGGLGSPVLQYLAAAGVGTIGIVDADEVSISNLQRQILYHEAEVGLSKAETAAQKLGKQNSNVHFNVYPYFLVEENGTQIIAEYDVVLGCTDNFPSRYLIDEVCKENGIPYVHGSIAEFEGQVAVFNYRGGPSYRSIFPEIPDGSDLPLGVIGVLPGIIGSMQTCEALKIITGTGQVLSGKLLIYDALQASLMKVDLG